MKISNRQQQELDFLCKFYCNREPSDLEIEEYFLFASKGDEIKNSNPLLRAQQFLNVNIAEWRKDLVRGFISIEELDDHFKDSPYWRKIRASIYSSITREFRLNLLQDGEYNAVLAFSNFPEVMASLT